MHLPALLPPYPRVSKELGGHAGRLGSRLVSANEGWGPAQLPAHAATFAKRLWPQFPHLKNAFSLPTHTD